MISVIERSAMKRRNKNMPNKAAVSLLGQIAMIPMLAWIANSAPPLWALGKAERGIV
jgi:hypothetical protein